MAERFTADTFVNDDRESGRRLRRWPERPSLTKVSGVKKWPPCEQWLNSEAGGRGSLVEPHSGAKPSLDCVDPALNRTILSPAPRNDGDAASTKKHHALSPSRALRLHRRVQLIQ